jgi:excisionase family DNA binding protein
MEKAITDVPGAAKHTGLKDVTIRLRVREKSIPHIRLGRRILFRVDELDKWLDAHAVPVSEKPK